MKMFESLSLFALMLFAEDTPNNLLDALVQYGALGIIAGILLWKDYKNEQFLQKMINDLKRSIDKMSDTIDKRLK